MGGNTGITGGGKSMGGGRRGDGRWDTKGGASWEKREKLSQHCEVFRNRKCTQREEPLWKGAGTGSARYGKREVRLPLPHPIYPQSFFNFQCSFSDLACLNQYLT